MLKYLVEDGISQQNNQTKTFIFELIDTSNRCSGVE